MFASNINGGKGGGGGENHTETHKHGLSLSLLFLPHHAHAGTHRTANELTECTFTQTNESSPLSVTQHYLPKSLTMELFSRRRWRLVSAQLSNIFGYCRLGMHYLIIFNFINTTAYHLGRYESASPSTKKLHDLPLLLLLAMNGFCIVDMSLLLIWDVS